MKTTQRPIRPSAFKSHHQLLKVLPPDLYWLGGHTAAMMAHAYYGSWPKLIYAELRYELSVKVVYWRDRLAIRYRRMKGATAHEAEGAVLGASLCHCDIRREMGRREPGDCE